MFDPERQHREVDSKIAVGLERIGQVYRALLWQVSQQHKLSPIQLQFLVFLDTHRADRCTVGGLAREFQLSAPTVSDAVSTLARKGLVMRRQRVKDRRSQTIELTEAGRSLAVEVNGYPEPIRAAVATWDEPVRVRFLDGVLNLIAALHGTGHIPVARLCRTCSHFDRNPGGDPPYFCRLIKRPFGLSDMRVDCPEHRPHAAR